MKTPGIVNAIGQIDDNLINGALKAEKKNTNTKWVSLAAGFAVLLISLFVFTIFFGDENTTVSVSSENATTVLTTITTDLPGTTYSTESVYITEPDSTIATTVSTVQTPATSPTTQPATETAFSEAYFYSVSAGEFSSYISGKVIAEEKIGNKYCDVSVEGGWKNNNNEWLTNETLRAEVYLINGVEKEIAVALKFLDKGDALTTTHYYVITNPTADLTAVKDYVIISVQPNNYGGEDQEDNISEEFIVEYTSKASNG